MHLAQAWLSEHVVVVCSPEGKGYLTHAELHREFAGWCKRQGVPVLLDYDKDPVLTHFAVFTLGGGSQSRLAIDQSLIGGHAASFSIQGDGGKRGMGRVARVGDPRGESWCPYERRPFGDLVAEVMGDRQEISYKDLWKSLVDLDRLLTERAICAEVSLLLGLPADRLFQANGDEFVIRRAA